MTAWGWIFMVGFRVLDVGALVVWLVWFTRLRDSEPVPAAPEDDGGGEEFVRRWSWSRPPEPPPAPAGPPALDLPKPDAEPWPHRRRDHTGDRAPAVSPARTPRRVPAER